MNQECAVPKPSLLQDRTLRQMFFINICLSGFVSSFLPWWMIGAIAFVTAAIMGIGYKRSFIASGFASFLLWILYGSLGAMSEDNLLYNLITQLTQSKLLTILFGAITGGVFIGLLASAGSLFRRQTEDLDGDCCPVS